MMNKQSGVYTFVFAGIVCVVCSLALAAVSEGLRPRRETNELIDARKNILKAVSLERDLPEKVSSRQILEVYRRVIEEVVVGPEGNAVEVDGIQRGDDQGGLPLYVYREGGRVLAYCFPVDGRGLWSMIYGYLALEADGVTIRGVTFYRHGETPGLGGEVSSAWFQKQFEGKRIYDDVENRPRPPEIVKGAAADRMSGRDLLFAVDGISGATLTSRGVSRFLAESVAAYEPYLKNIRRTGAE